VIACELVVRGRGPESVRHRLVKVRAPTLRQHPVGGLQDQHVPEAEHLAVGRSLGPHQVLPHEFSKGAVDVRRVFVQQIGNAGRVEGTADHRRDADHSALVRGEAVEPRSQECVDGRRKRDAPEVAEERPRVAVANEETLVDQHRKQLLDEEGIALRCGSDPLLGVVIECRVVDQVLDQTVNVCSRERSK
jgi:hypothetical protein